MAGGNKKCGKKCGGIQYVSEDKKQNRGTSREVEVERSTKETIDSSNNGLYHKVTNSS